MCQKRGIKRQSAGSAAGWGPHREVAGADDGDGEDALVLEGDDALGGAAHQLPPGRLLLAARGLLPLRRLAGGLEGAVLDIALQRRHNLHVNMLPL